MEQRVLKPRIFLMEKLPTMPAFFKASRRLLVTIHFLNEAIPLLPINEQRSVSSPMIEEVCFSELDKGI